MKLVLYSGGDNSSNTQIDRGLLSLLDIESPKLTFIPSCHFHGNSDYREIVDQFRPLGVKKIIKWEIDKPYSKVMKDVAFKSDIIYLGGGNTYYFLKYLKKQGLLKELKQWVKAGGLLCGLSAGAILMTKKIETAGFPSFDKDENEENIKNLTSLDLVDFDFFPHYRNSKRYDKELIAFSQKQENPVYACPDGSGIIVSDDEIKIIGKTACFYQGKKFFINKN